MSNKKIGIVGWKTGDNSFGITVPYMEYFSRFGNVHVLGTNDDMQADLDLLILPGGRDIATWKYVKPGEHISMTVGYSDPFLEQFDDRCLGRYIENGTPIFSICRGFQAVNIFFKGTLWQNLGKLHPFMSDPNEREELVHEVQVDWNGERDEQGKLPIMKVNSLHHQGIRILGEDLNIIAQTTFRDKKGKPVKVHDKYEIIEAIQHKTLPIMGVQWHSEIIQDELSYKMIKQLLTVKEVVNV